MSIMQFAIFMTPVFWPSDKFKNHPEVLNFNPFYHLLHAVRAPLLDQPVEPLSYIVLVSMAVVGWLVTFGVFARTRRRIVHYL